MRARPLWHYGLEELTLEVLSTYLAGGLEESQHLEFKREGYGRSDGDRKELLRDVAAMVNGGGGLLLIGMAEDGNGHACDVRGIVEADLQVERILRSANDGIEERVMGLDARVVPVARQCGVVAVRCPRSPRTPHMVTGQGDYRFWRRHGTDKTKMRLSDLRDEFRRSVTVTEELIRGQKLRLRRLHREATAPTLAVTVAPYGTPQEVVDIYDVGLRRLLARPPTTTRGALRGLAARDEDDHPVVPSLGGLIVRPRHGQWELEFGRDGHLFLFSSRIGCGPGGRADRAISLRSDAICGLAVDTVALARALYALLGVGGPFVIGLDLLHADGRTLDDPVNTPATAAAHSHVATEPRIHVALHEVASLQGPPHPTFEPLRRLWNAFEHERPPRRLFSDEGMSQSHEAFGL